MTDLHSIVAGVQSWVRSSDQTNAAMAAVIGVDEKVVRQAAASGWNPRFSTLSKFVAAMKRDVTPNGDQRRQPKRKAA